MFKTCHLTRNYSIVSLVGIVVVAVTLVYFYQSIAVKSLMERESQANSDLAHTIANTIWPKYAGFLMQAGSTPAEQLIEDPVTGQIRDELLSKLRGLRVAKVKIYDLNGIVVFSTQLSQIGDDKSRNSGFISAVSGLDANEIIFRNNFSSFEGTIYDRNLVASYVPVRRSFDQPVEGVFEIYSDVTQLIADIETNSNQILVTVTGLMLLLYLFLLMIVRRAQARIEAHEKVHNHEQKERVAYLEYHDAVTGLLNRRGLLREMKRYKLNEHVGDVGVGIIAIKLLNLGAISGGLGHKRVIELLRLAGERIKSCASGSRSLSHLDSSEFVLVEENLFSEAELELIVEKLQAMFMEPFILDNNSVTLAIAIGTDASWGSKTSEYMLGNALLALSECEVTGKSFLKYEESMELKKQEYLNLEVDLSNALLRREFVLYYQPKIDVQTGEVAGMEALLRWKHPKRGVVMPVGFIHLLEDRGHIVELGQWLLTEACEQCQRWHEDGHENLRMAVNVSLRQLMNKHFVKDVEKALKQSGLPPQSLELELTESILAEDTDRVVKVLSELKVLGVMLSIDDFGTGYSSLSYLLHFPFDFIKIDRSFIRDMMHNHDHAVLTDAIITMAKSLKLGVIAEGVETAEQLARVREMGCDEVQGFYFSQAVSSDTFPTVISTINTGQQGIVRH